MVKAYTTGMSIGCTWDLRELHALTSRWRKPRLRPGQSKSPCRGGNRGFRLRLLPFFLLFLHSLATATPQRVSIDDAALDTTALQPGQQAVVAVKVAIQPGFHTQSHEPGDGYIPFVAKLLGNPAIDSLPPVYPAGKSRFYPSLGALNIYTGTITIYLPIQVNQSAAAGPLTLSGTIHEQACDDSQCYAPVTIPFTIATQVVPIGNPVQPANGPLFTGFDPAYFAKVLKQPIRRRPSPPRRIWRALTFLAGISRFPRTVGAWCWRSRSGWGSSLT